MKAGAAITTGILAVVLLGAAAGGGFLAGRRTAAGGADEVDAATAPAEEVKVVAPVQTAPLTESTITESLTAYGTVISRASDQQTVSAEIETKVSRLLVSAGQFVEAGQPLAELAPSPDTTLQMHQAQNAVDAATRDLAGVRERFNMKLATNPELQTSQNALRDAKLKLEDLNRRGAVGPQTLKAPRAGVVAKIDVSLAQLVPAGGAVMEIDDQSNVEVRLGVEPSEAPQLKVDQEVKLFPMRGSGNVIVGKIRLVTRRVNPETRLVDVFASLPAESGLLLDSYLRAMVTVASEKGLVVPRSAVLPDGDGYSLFTVEKDHAVKHAVTLGLQSEKDVQLAEGKPPLKPGDAVVVGGNYELEDGMSVTMGSANE